MDVAAEAWEVEKVAKAALVEAEEAPGVVGEEDCTGRDTSQSSCEQNMQGHCVNGARCTQPRCSTAPIVQLQIGPYLVEYTVVRQVVKQHTLYDT